MSCSNPFKNSQNEFTLRGSVYPPVAGVSVFVYEVDGLGNSVGDPIGDPTTTDSNGDFSVVVRGPKSTPQMGIRALRGIAGSSSDYLKVVSGSNAGFYDLANDGRVPIKIDPSSQFLLEVAIEVAKRGAPSLKQALNYAKEALKESGFDFKNQSTEERTAALNEKVLKIIKEKMAANAPTPKQKPQPPESSAPPEPAPQPPWLGGDGGSCRSGT